MTRANDVDGERMFLVRLLLLLHTRQDRHEFHQWELLFLLFSCFLLTIFGANADGGGSSGARQVEGRKEAGIRSLSGEGKKWCGNSSDIKGNEQTTILEWAKLAVMLCPALDGCRAFL